MPNIREYQPPQESLRPSEIGVEATAAAARRGGAFFNQAAQAWQTLGQHIGSGIKEAGDAAVKYVAHREISAGAMHFAQMQDSYQTAWNKTLNNPNLDYNDPSIAEQFRAGMQPSLDNFKQSFITDTGRAWAESHVDAFREHMFHQTSADMATIAGKAIEANHEQEVTSATHAVYERPDSLQFQLDQLQSSREAKIGSSPTVTGVKAATLRTELEQKDAGRLVDAAIKGAITNGGPWEKIASDKKYAPYVDATQLAQYVKQEERQKKADLYYQRAAESLAKSQTAEAANSALSENFTNNVAFDENGRATIKPEYFKNIMQIEAKYPGAVTPRSESMINWGQAQLRARREAIVTDPVIKARLIDGMARTDDSATTDTDILTAAAADKLDAHDTSVLLNLRKTMELSPFRGRQDLQDSVKEKLGVNLVQDGHQRYTKFIESFMPQYLEARKAGTLPPNALNLSDPDSMISQAMKEHIPTDQELLNGFIAKRLHGLPLPGGPAVPTAPTPAPETAGQKPFVPPRTWEFSPSTNRYRDPKTNFIYDINGKRL